MIAFLLLLTACTNATNNSEIKGGNVEEIEVTLTLSKDHATEILEEKSVKTNKDSDLMTIMKEHFEIEENNGFIESINGLATDYDAERGWIFYINDEMAIVGAEDLTLSNNDFVRFDYQAWE